MVAKWLDLPRRRLLKRFCEGAAFFSFLFDLFTFDLLRCFDLSYHCYMFIFQSLRVTRLERKSRLYVHIVLFLTFFLIFSLSNILFFDSTVFTRLISVNHLVHYRVLIIHISLLYLITSGAIIVKFLF